MPHVGVFFAGVAAGVTGAAIGAPLAAIVGGAYATGYAIGVFATSTIGSLLISVATSALLAPKGPRRQKVDDSRVNVRLESADRWTAWGTCAVGGAVGPFMEFDADGHFWYIVAHCDGELTGSPTYILDGITVTLSNGSGGFVAGDVLTDDFCLTDKGDQYEGTGTKVPIFRLYTVTPTSSADYGTLPAAFTTAFPDLPVDFYGAGVVFTVVRCRAVKPENRHKAYRWRGAIGIGEPSVTLVGNFGRFYDPREVAHDIGDPTTWTASDGNAAIIWAGFRTAARGKGQPLTAVDWVQVEAQADICDTTVLDRSANPVPRYRCGIAFADGADRGQCERQILAAMDSFVAWTDTGKAYPVPGYYTAPAITLSQRDVFAFEDIAVNTGARPMHGVICEYISPELGWARVESAPWVNPDRYDGISEPEYDRISVESCQSHAQAVLLAKAYGQRMQAMQQAGLEVGIRGVHAIGRRAVNLAIDTIYDGPYEIVTPVEEDSTGTRFGFAVVPLASDRWTLNVGEEGEPPQLPPALTIDNSLEDAANTVLTAESVTTSTGQAVRLVVTFDAPVRVDRFFVFRFAAAGGTPVWEYFTTDMDELFAVSRIVDDGEEYDVEVQTRTAGGRANDWTVVGSIIATADPTAPAALAAAGATGGVGVATATYTTGNSANQASVAIYRNTVNTLPGSPVAVRGAGPNVSGSYPDTLAAGTYYYWLAPRNGSGVEGTVSGSYSVTVT